MTARGLDLVPAVGGERMVPAGDAIARAYILLCLRLDQHRPGLVDAFYGPADLKAQVDMEQHTPPARLADAAAALLGRLPAEVEDPGRREYLRAQLVALEAQAREADGASLPYEDLVARCFDMRMPRVDDAIFEAAAHELEELLPGNGTVDDRLAAWDAGLTIAPERVQVASDWLMARCRERAASLFGLPPGERARISMVRNRPWGGYNWYEGGRSSRVEINLDLPTRAGDLVGTVAHETYPGNHLDASTKEAELVDGEGRIELSLLSINTPECLLHEGLADLGVRFAVPPEDEVDLLAELFAVAGLAIASDPAAAREAAVTQARAARARDVLAGVGGNAALMRHVDGRTHDDVVDYFVSVGRRPRERAEKSLEFIEDPLWRTYVFVYREGEELLAAWLERVPAAEQPARFRRLLAEALTPSSIVAELSSP